MPKKPPRAGRKTSLFPRPVSVVPTQASQQVAISFGSDGTNGQLPIRDTTATLGFTWTTASTFIRTQVITSGTSITAHASARKWICQLVGAGGASGSATGAGGGVSGGGGAGGYAEKTFTVTPSTSYTCAIGTGGTGGAGAGPSGGNTTLTVGATTVTAFGGSGSTGATAPPNVSAGGVGAVVSTNGDVNMGGEPGNPGIMESISSFAGGKGGSGPFGAGGRSANVGTGYGAGGGGVTHTGGGTTNGKSGTDGLILVREFT